MESGPSAIQEVQLTAPVLTQHYPTLKTPNMCVLVALAMALDGSDIPRPDLNDIVDVALELGITAASSGGISAAGCVRLSMEYGQPGHSSENSLTNKQNLEH